MEAKRKRKVLPYVDTGNGGDFSTDHFILTSHEIFLFDQSTSASHSWGHPQNCLLWPKEAVQHNAV